MQNLSNEDLISLINFYKNKSSDIELEFLKLQIVNKKELTNLESRLTKENSDRFIRKEFELNSRIKELEDTLLKLNKKNIKNKTKN